MLPNENKNVIGFPFTLIYVVKTYNINYQGYFCLFSPHIKNDTIELTYFMGDDSYEMDDSIGHSWFRLLL